ncbi:MAG: hypothetical protein KDK26_03640 [Roseivivax sp.]|nr:hypothetical protein [Roseivivax sp.]
MDRDIVIGSGPAGIAVALARLEKGRPVLILDGGRELEPEAEARRAAFVAEVGDGLPDARQSEAWRSPQYSTPPGQARRYGSDFAMETASDTLCGGDEIGLRASRAAGGLSNLWGSAMLPWRPEDIANWPVSHEDLAASWRALARHVPISGTNDALAPLFPGMDMSGANPLKPGSQIALLLARANARRAALAADGVVIGQSRVAVDAACRRCGLCLHGCPWQQIWSARHTLDKLRGDPRVTYEAAPVAAISETDTGAVAHLADGGTRAGARLFLAAGVLESARIVLASPGAPDGLTLRDSSYAFLPALQPAFPRPAPDRLPLHTLPQAFVEMAGQGGAPSVHAQIYAWNEFYIRDLMENYGFGLPPLRLPLGIMARHLIVAQMFLHSDLSHAITLTRAADGRLTPRIARNPGTQAAMASQTGRLARALRRTGLVPLRFATRTAPVGASFHVGASLPMSSAPRGSQTDVLGRPAGAARLHVVDASVLPAVPATTITFGVMGNAHRIGRATP